MNEIKILLIEDNPADARLIKENLRDALDNFYLEWKEGLSSGLAYMAKKDVDIILVDLNLLDSQGLETFTKINAEFPDKPIIVLTGLNDKELASRAVREGAQDYLVKGEVNGALLDRCIRYSIERKKLEKALHIDQQNLERKVVERTSELKERYEEIEQLNYAIAHDLMVPLATITGFIGYLKKDVATGNRMRIEIDMGLIEDAADKMKNLLSNTLEKSNIGNLSNPMESVPFRELIQQALSQAEKKLESSQAKIRISEDFPVVNVDRPRIIDVLANLIDNCIRYCGEKPPCIQIGHYAAEKENVFFVKDEGVGIDPTMKNCIFKLFYKGNDSISPNLGLGLSRRIIEAHGGRMWIESELKKGCTVYFTIPFVSNSK